MQNGSNPNGVTRMALGALDALSKGSEAFWAVTHYLSCRMAYNESARELFKSAQKDGDLGFVRVNGASAEEFAKHLRNSGINCMVCRTHQGTKEDYAIVFSIAQEKEVEFQRQVFLASRNKVFQVEKEVLGMFTKEPDLECRKGLTFAEYSSLKERALNNKLMFSVEKSKEGLYTFYFRREDMEQFKVLFSGMEQEQKSREGQKVYEQKNYDRASREKAVNIAIGQPDKEFVMGSPNGKSVIYVNQQGFYFERNGSKTIREFVSRNDDNFSERLCHRMDQMNDVQILKGEQAAEIGRELRYRVLYKNQEKTCSTQEALKTCGFNSIKDVTKDKLDDMEKDIEQMRDSSYAEAVYRLKCSAALYHTAQEHRSRVYVTETEREAFNAEHQMRMAFERCVTAQPEVYSKEIEKYLDGELGFKDISDFVLRHKDEIEKGVSDKIYEPYDMPPYKDHQDERERDFQRDHQKDEFSKNDFEEINVDPEL